MIVTVDGEWPFAFAQSDGARIDGGLTTDVTANDEDECEEELHCERQRSREDRSDVCVESEMNSVE